MQALRDKIVNCLSPLWSALGSTSRVRSAGAGRLDCVTILANVNPQRQLAQYELRVLLSYSTEIHSNIIRQSAALPAAVHVRYSRQSNEFRLNVDQRTAAQIQTKMKIVTATVMAVEGGYVHSHNMTSYVEYQEEVNVKPSRITGTQDALAAIQPLHITPSPTKP